MSTLLGFLLLVAASTSAATEAKVEFSDRIVSVKDKSAQKKGVTVAFEKHAAVYHLDRRLLGAANDAKKSGNPVTVTVLADSLRIVRIGVPKRARK